jgi:hypothetical protein
MTNFDKIIAVQTDILETLYTYTGMLVENTNIDDDEEIMDMIDKLTTNLKRVGDTNVFEQVDDDSNDQVANMIEEKDGDIK